MNEIRVGIVGAGWIAQSHLRVLESLDGVDVVAVCDLDRARAEALAASAGASASAGAPEGDAGTLATSAGALAGNARDPAGGNGAHVYTDWRALLDTEDLGALFVCTPPLAHRDPAVAALDRGLPVYLEKPIARTASDAAAIVAAAQSSGAVCAVGFQWHAIDVLDDLRGLLEGQQIGLMVGTSIGPTMSRPWFIDRRAGGGNLLERGSHHIDLARTVGGDVVSVQAAASRVRLARGAEDAGDIDDALTMLLQLASGALATIVVAWTKPGQPGTYGLDVVASESTLRLDLDPDFTLHGSSGGRQVSRTAAVHPHERSITRFLSAARDNDPSAVVCAPPDAAASLAVAIAAEQALETGRTVTVTS